MSPISSLYIHFPFCESKCHYCDFYSLGRERTQAGDAPRFEEALKTEATLKAPLLSAELETLFFGGGTPSMTPPDSMARALEPLWQHTRTTSKTEWTMEANPSSVTLESLRAYRTLGVNRISMGVQALRPDLLTQLGRVHSREAVFTAIDAIFAAGLTNASVDLLCGVPGQSLQDLESALSELTRYPITHLSCYLLTLPPHHRMHRDLPNEDTQLAHLLLIDQWMKSQGFEHYEISNFAKPGYRAQHNLNYWTGRSYLGLGPSAHSFDAANGRRFKNFSSLHRYAKLLSEGKSVEEWSESLTSEQKELEKWMLALRLDEGFPSDWLTQPHQQTKAQFLESKGLIETHPAYSDRKRLTARGFALSDQIITQFVA